jgi:hypothetical protein
MLPEDDTSYLQEAHPGFSVTVENSMTCVVIPNFGLPAGYTVEKSDLLLRLNSLYPDSVPDMWWFDPAVLLTSGQPILNADLVEAVLGRQWQRWSRHLEASQWRTGVDGVRTYIALIRTELAKTAGA